MTEFIFSANMANNSINQSAKNNRQMENMIVNFKCNKANNSIKKEEGKVVLGEKVNLWR